MQRKKGEQNEKQWLLLQSVSECFKRMKRFLSRILTA